MNKYIIVLIALAVSLVSHAQNTYQGKIMDTNKNGLPGATIQSINNPRKGVITDLKGNFEITLSSGNQVRVNYIGYKSKIVSLSENFNKIILEEDKTALIEVVVSASREQQRRSEVPASIATLSLEQIEQSKAFGLEQLVNQAPGVFMATSKAASNEQHFMSVRSPITTKPLFLYLEDGLPIHPTGVFNHNSLLEINNTAIGRIEILKGPASSIYGSGAIGGSFNFMTKKPTWDPSGSVGFQVNDIGLSRYELEYSQYAGEKVGLYLGSHYIQRKDGPIAYSDYEKFALTLKGTVAFSNTLQWTNVLDFIDYRSDMTGSLSEIDYLNGNYESDQTFTERTVSALRFRSTLDKQWNEDNNTSFNFLFRDNETGQIPSYRISQFREQGQLTGKGSGEINSNQFQSFVGIIQHKIDFDFGESSLIVGISTDFSPQKYVARSTEVIVDIETQKNIGFNINQNDFILNYQADILNYAGYLQYELNPLENVKITAALRYDQFEYDYNNLAEGIAGPMDSYDVYNHLSPKLGANYNFSRKAGIYANYSVGFTPPETSNLYRNKFIGVGGEVFDLKPSEYDNYEIGGYFNLPSKLKVDFAIYLLNGRNTLLSLRNENDDYFYANAGKTRSYGVEYGITYFPFPELRLTHNGSFAKHRYITFFNRGINYSDTERETAPSLLGYSQVSYRPHFAEGLSLTAEHQFVGEYNTSFEGQVVLENGNNTTATYGGNSIFNFRINYAFKGFEIWGEVLNIFDTLYAARATFSPYTKENKYTIGNPRAFHFGIKYSFGQ